MNAHSSAVSAHGSTHASSLLAPRNGKAKQEDGATFAEIVDADHTPPAQAARQALEDRPDLASRPFGAIVSLLARHLELPEAASASADEPDAPAGEEDQESAAAESTADTAPIQEA